MPNEGLMCVLHEFIIPHNVSFYEILSVKPKTNKGLLMDEKPRYPKSARPDQIYEMIVASNFFTYFDTANIILHKTRVILSKL